MTAVAVDIVVALAALGHEMLRRRELSCNEEGGSGGWLR